MPIVQRESGSCFVDNPITISVIIVSYNTCDMTRRCLEDLYDKAKGVAMEVIVVDNGSADGTVTMIEEEFPNVLLLTMDVNLGFSAANNIGFSYAKGRYCVLLNTDAFFHAGALQRAIQRMDDDHRIALAGGRLVGPDGEWQPSARMFPSLLNDFLHLSGLAARYPQSRFFGRADRTWASPEDSAEVDWVPGAFSIIRKGALEAVGLFDERFFLYYEEVDLCRRMRAAGYGVWYFGDVVVTHIGGVTTKATCEDGHYSEVGSQLTLWRMRSALLYYRKHHGYFGALGAYLLERLWYRLREWKNGRDAKGKQSRKMLALIKCAWQETEGGKVSPPRPW
ncbi:MAG: glycosyltransferase family 2 protein [Chlamydiales bacterium]|nr:glycosyltransferase family 2 protein [Chlamydiales bacterium]